MRTIGNASKYQPVKQPNALKRDIMFVQEENEQ
jgi:hypothetical protein